MTRQDEYEGLLRELNEEIIRELKLYNRFRLTELHNTYKSVIEAWRNDK
jgi:hypothetical protein